MLLADLVLLHANEAEEPLSNGHIAQLLWSVSHFQTFLGRPPRARDLNDETVNKYLRWMQAQGRASDTVRSRRGNLVTLWLAAWQRNLVAQPPKRVKPIRSRKPATVAWTREEVEALHQAALRLRGKYEAIGLSKAGYWGSLIPAAWDTALRRGDLLSLAPQQVPPKKYPCLVVRQSKTGHDHPVYFRAETLDSIRRFVAEAPERPRVWPLWTRKHDAFCRDFRAIVAAAGIRPGTFKWLRRGSITDAESQEYGAGTMQAGHKHRSVTERYYLDLSQLACHRPLPRALELRSRRKYA